MSTRRCQTAGGAAHGFLSPPVFSEWRPDVGAGATLPFTLQFSPARQVAQGERRRGGSTSGGKRGITDHLELGWWLGAHQAEWGVHLLTMRAAEAPDRVEVERGAKRPAVYLAWSVSGTMLCQDATRLAAVVASGVGRGKAFGLGLLLLGDGV